MKSSIIRVNGGYRVVVNLGRTYKKVPFNLYHKAIFKHKDSALALQHKLSCFSSLGGLRLDFFWWNQELTRFLSAEGQGRSQEISFMRKHLSSLQPATLDLVPLWLHLMT
jgi:hypothetical protein